MSKDRGFTYIEMLLVIGITVLIASLLVPNLVGERASRDEWKFKSDLSAMAANARSRSIESGDVVSLYLDKENNVIKAVQEPASSNPIEYQTMPVPPDMTPEKFSADQNESSADQWRVPFFPDGTSAGGGIEFQAGNETYSLIIERRTARARIAEGKLPDLSMDTWQAGNYAPRQ